ncbi:MAG: DUF4389 domain-containing protein [Thermoleophilia bacterium]|nr:DUF4389 domain-containing protein [Thermoleophilia bacterium]
MYPVTYEADYLKERNRWTTFFRLIVAIPWMIVGIFYAIAATVVVVIAWFALLILGRYPLGMYNFVGGVLRFSMRVNGFVSLQTDAWPPFGIGEDPAYPVRIRFNQPAARQSRLKTLFRLILVIPLFFVYGAMSSILSAVSMVSWMAIVFRGYQPAAIHNAMAYTIGWETRFSAYAQLMRDEYPPVGDEIPVVVDPPAATEAIASEEPEPASLDPGASTAQESPAGGEESPPPPPAATG